MAHEHFIISTLNLPDNKIKDIQVLKINGVFHLKITLTKEDTLCPFCGGISCGLIITFLLLAFLQLLIGIAVDSFVRTVVKPSLNPIPLVLRTSFSPMRFSIQLPKLYITSTQLIRISLTSSTFLFLWFSSMPTAFLSPLASLFLSILELMNLILHWKIWRFLSLCFC